MIIKKTNKKTTTAKQVGGRDKFVRIYLVKKGFIEVILSNGKFLQIFVYNFTVFRNNITLYISMFWNSSFILLAL